MKYVRPAITLVAWATLVLGVLVIGGGITASVQGAQSPFLYYLCGTALVAFGIVCFVVRSKDPSPKSESQGANTLQAGDLGKTHLLTFTVGVREQHTVAYSFDQVWGWLTISVDGVTIITKLVTYTLRLVSRFEFPVGETEVHTVRIERHRALLFSFARPQPIKAFVDGVLVAETDGRGPTPVH